MKNRWTSFWYLAGRKALSRSRRGWWTGVTEATLASVLILSGVILFVGFVTVNFMSPSPDDFYGWLLNYFLKPFLASVMCLIGGVMVAKALWKLVRRLNVAVQYFLVQIKLNC